MRSDFRLYHGNDLEVLAGLLAAELAKPCPGRALLAPDTILIPQPAMRRWLQKTLAEAHGVAANLRLTWDLDLSWTRFGGAGRYNDINDRDFIAATIKFAF